jgi:hypothetical protein
VPDPSRDHFVWSIATLPKLFPLGPESGKRNRYMTLPGAGLADEVDDLMVVDEVELCQGVDAVAVERGLEREVKPNFHSLVDVVT